MTHSTPPSFRSPIDVFGDWALQGKDKGMETGHARAVANMLDFAIPRVQSPESFSFLDAGCGNGWVVRNVREMAGCRMAMGVDGAEAMIEKAQSLDPEHSDSYQCADLMTWTPEQPLDLVHSMEVFYYVEDPASLIKHAFEQWIAPGGRLILGVDFYRENTVSHDWQEQCGVDTMTLLSQGEWMNAMDQAGFQECEHWRVDQHMKPDWEGTLVLTGVVPSPK